MANVTKTTFIVTQTDTEYSVPGNWTAQSIKDSYASQVPGIGNMTAEEEIQDNGDGTATKVITFKPRTGSKG